MSVALLESFALLAASEGGVAKLRELILSLAVRGKLVPQDRADEPASELRGRIRAEKERLIAEGKIKREKALPAIRGEEKPFELPDGWEWIRLSELAWPQAGFAFKSTLFNDRNEGLPLIRIRDVGSNRPATYFSGDYRDEFVVSAGDWLVSMDGDFRVAEWKGSRALLNQRVTRLVFIEEAVKRRLICIALQAELSKLQGQKAYTTVDHLSGGQIAACLIPLPPLPEQSRIVAKVEALMALCDRLEAQQGEAARVQAHWTQAALDQLAESGDADEFAGNWQALAEHFDTLFATPASIDALDTTLLQLAVRGKLVPQNPADEPASELLKHIRAEKDRLIAAGQIKRDKPLPPIADDENPFELPEGWEWARMQEVFDVRDGTHDTPKYVDSDGVPLITSRNFCDGRISFDDAKLISWQDHELIKKRSAVTKGDILYSMIGGNIGNQVMVDTDREFSIKNVALFKYYQSNITPPQYLNIFLRTVTISLQSKAVGGAQPFVSLSLLRNILFPLPPTSEQSRIVAKLDELLALTRTLRARLTDARALQARLASALADEVAV